MQELTDLLYRALASPFGLKVRCEDFQKMAQQLYIERRKLLDPALDTLQFRHHADGSLLIVKTKKEPTAP